jgi:hypothetical protein
VAFERTPEEALGGLAIYARLHKHIKDFAVGTNSTPHIQLLALCSTKTSSMKNVSL